VAVSQRLAVQQQQLEAAQQQQQEEGTGEQGQQTIARLQAELSALQVCDLLTWLPAVSTPGRLFLGPASKPAGSSRLPCLCTRLSLLASG
jgi:hypothetical protein